MTTTTPSAALIPVAPVFTNTERLALAGFLAGYSGLTREAYELDLRQYASWCHQHHPPAVHHRRVLPVRRRGRPARTLTRRARLPSPAGLRLASHRPGPQRTGCAAGGRWAGLARRARAVSSLALNGLRVSEATGANIENLGV